MGTHETKKCIAKETVNQVKKQLTEKKKNLHHLDTCRGLLSRMFKELKENKTETTNKPIKTRVLN